LDEKRQRRFARLQREGLENGAGVGLERDIDGDRGTGVGRLGALDETAAAAGSSRLPTWTSSTVCAAKMRAFAAVYAAMSP